MVPGQHLNIDMILQEIHTHFYIPLFLSSKASLYLYSVSVNRLTHVFSSKISEYFIMKRYYVYIIIDIIFSICFVLHCIIIIWSNYTLATCSRILVMGSTQYFYFLVKQDKLIQILLWGKRFWNKFLFVVLGFFLTSSQIINRGSLTCSE